MIKSNFIIIIDNDQYDHQLLLIIIITFLNNIEI